MATGTAVATVADAIAEQSVADAWKAYQVTEHKGIEFGKACYEYRAKHGAQGVAGAGLLSLLRKLEIKEGKAYYWLNEYEVSIGVKERKERIIKEAPSATTQPEPLATVSIEKASKDDCVTIERPDKSLYKAFILLNIQGGDYPFVVEDTLGSGGEGQRFSSSGIGHVKGYRIVRIEYAPKLRKERNPLKRQLNAALVECVDKSSPATKTRQESHRENIDNAKGWLIAYLEDGPRSTKPINYRQHGSTAKTKEGRDVGRPLTRVTDSAGNVTSTFAQAVKELGIITKPTGKGGHTWELPKGWNAARKQNEENKANELRVLLYRFSGPSLVQAVSAALNEGDNEKEIISTFKKVIKDLQGYVKRFEAKKSKSRK